MTPPVLAPSGFSASQIVEAVPEYARLHEFPAIGHAPLLEVPAEATGAELEAARIELERRLRALLVGRGLAEAGGKNTAVRTGRRISVRAIRLEGISFLEPVSCRGADAEAVVVAARACGRVAFPVRDAKADAAFAPEAILVSAGYDAHQRDPLGNLRVTEAGYQAVATGLGELAGRLGLGGVGLTLEGGYDLEALRGSAAATVRGLLAGLSGGG